MEQNNQSRELSDREVVAGLKAAAKKRLFVEIEMIVVVAQVEAQELHRDHGYPSLLSYCVDKLGMDEKIAARRIETARLLQWALERAGPRAQVQQIVELAMEQLGHSVW